MYVIILIIILIYIIYNNYSTIDITIGSIGISISILCGSSYQFDRSEIVCMYMRVHEGVCVFQAVVKRQWKL